MGKMVTIADKIINELQNKNISQRSCSRCRLQALRL